MEIYFKNDNMKEMNILLIFTLFYIVSIHAKEAFLENHSIEKDLIKIFKKVYVDYRFHHSKEETVYPTTYFPGSIGIDGRNHTSFTRPVFYYNYIATYKHDDYTCVVDKISEHDPFETYKGFIASSYCPCCAPETIKYPDNNQLFIDETMIPKEMLSKTFVNSLLLILAINICYLYKKDKGARIFIGVLLFIALAYFCYKCQFILQSYSTPKFDVYNLYNIKLSNNSVLGCYMNRGKEYTIEFCENADSLVECGFIQQNSMLKQNIFVDEGKHFFEDYSSFNESLKMYQLSLTLTIIFMIYQIFN